MKFATAYLENLYPNECLRLSGNLTFFPRLVGEVHATTDDACIHLRVQLFTDREISATEYTMIYEKLFLVKNAMK